MENIAKQLKPSTSLSAISVPFNSLFKVLFIVSIERAKRAQFDTYQISNTRMKKNQTSEGHISVSYGTKNTKRGGNSVESRDL